MTDLIVQAFPLLVVAVVITVLVLAVRLDRRLSRGSYSAGPRERLQPSPPGQERSPWELQAIEDQLRTVVTPHAPVVRHYDLTATVNRLTTAAGLHEPHHQLPITATEADLAVAITRIEHQLALPPLTEGSNRS